MRHLFVSFALLGCFSAAATPLCRVQCLNLQQDLMSNGFAGQWVHLVTSAEKVYAEGETTPTAYNKAMKICADKGYAHVVHSYVSKTYSQRLTGLTWPDVLISYVNADPDNSCQEPAD